MTDGTSVGTRIVYDSIGPIQNLSDAVAFDGTRLLMEEPTAERRFFV